MSEIPDSVNDILAFFAEAKRAYEKNGQHQKAVRMVRFDNDLRLLVKEVERLDALTRPIPTIDGESLADLPKDLLAELSITKTDDLEDQLVTVINAAGGEADIDTILIYLFRKFKVVQTRRFLQNKLWRMTQKNLLFSVDGKKGHYSTTPPEPDALTSEIDELLGDTNSNDTRHQAKSDLSPMRDDDAWDDDCPF